MEVRKLAEPGMHADGGGLYLLVTEKREKDGVLPGGDDGWVFASLARNQKEVQPIAEPKEYRRDPETKKKVSILPGLHTLRRTYLSVATEAGVSEIDRHVLVNHAFGRQNVNATYIEQAFDHLAQCQTKIERALLDRNREMLLILSKAH